MSSALDQPDPASNKAVFNGDVGVVERADMVEQRVGIRFDDRVVGCDFGEPDEVSLAYAVTIHKSRGSNVTSCDVHPPVGASSHETPDPAPVKSVSLRVSWHWKSPSAFRRSHESA